WLSNAKIRDETSSRASVRNGDGSIRESLVPLTHSRRYDLVTLPARRDKMPLVMLTDGDALRIAHMQLRDGKAFPVAERNFAEALVHAIAVWRKAERTAHKFHRLAGAPKRARNVIEVGGNAACKGKKTTKDVSTVAGLQAPPRVQWNVMAPLQSAGDVPIGFSMTNIVERRRPPCRLGHHSVLPTTKSGASGCLMPTM